MPPTRKTILFAAYTLSLLALHWSVLRDLVALAVAHPVASHTVLAPFIALAMMYERRRQIFAEAQSYDIAGAGVVALGALVATAAFFGRLSISPDARLTLAVACLVALWIGGFMFVY